MNQFLRLFNMAVMKGISMVWILSCFARLLPYFFSLALPMAFLVALLLTLGSLSESGEVMALRSSGFSFAEILWPFFTLAVGLSALLFYINHRASPEGFHAFRNLSENALTQVTQLNLEAGAFTPLGDWQLYTKDVDRKTGKLKGVYLVRLRGERRGLRVEAPEGEMTLERGRGFWLSLYQGYLRMPEMVPTKFMSAGFASYRLFIPLFRSNLVARELDLQELTTRRLREKLTQPALDWYHKMEYTTERALRSAGAFTPFVFFWIGCPLGLRLEKHAKATGFAISLVVLFFYYGLLAIGIGLGRRHLELSPFTPWMPVVAGLLLGAALWRKRLSR